MELRNRLFQRTTAVFLTLLFIIVGNSALDAQVKNRSGEDSTIYISNTVFVPKHPYESGRENWGVSVGDINKDGKIDVVSCSQLDSKINVHLNNGRGEFNDRTSYPAGNFPRDVCLGDFNKDGWLDIASVSIKDMKLTWMLSQNGTFSSKKAVTTGPFPHALTSADVNADGNPDIVTVTNSNHSVNIHLGDGTGNFSAATAIRTGGNPRSVLVEDINDDGLMDLVVGADDRTINIHLGIGGGKFKPKFYVLTAESIWGLGVADFNNDGFKDIAGVSYSVNKLCIHLNTGKADKKSGKMIFEQAKYIESGDKNFDLVVGDFDQDGDVDVVTASTRDEVINVHLNDGKGNFSEKNVIMGGNWNSAIASADFDGDKDPDLVTSSIKDNRINIYRNMTIAQEEEATATCVYGTIYDKDSKKPLPAIVSIVKPDGFSFKSVKVGQDGKYRICGVPFYKGYSLRVKAKGFPKYEENFDLPKDTPKEGLKKDVYLERIKETFVYGKVIDKETQQALPNAVLTIADKNGNTITTITIGANGKYKYNLPFDSGYLLTAEFDGYTPKSGTVSLFPDDYPNGVEKNFELQKIKPKTTACVHGHVLDEKSKDKLPDADLKVLDADGNIVGRVKSDATGFYEACDIPFGDYEIAATKQGYMFKVEKFTLLPSHAEGGLDKDIELMKFEIGMSIVLENIYYDVAKATLRPESKAELDRLIEIMNQNPTLVVEIAGHTDSDGSEAYNQNLSQRRAQSVVDYLLDADIPTERMEARGYGETNPIVPNNSKENKQLNRRTEFTVLDF